MRKGQQEAVTAVLISGVLLGVVGSVYFWGLPLLQKSRDVTSLGNAEAFMLTLNEKIKQSASLGSRENLAIEGGGLLQFSGGTLTYILTTDGTIYAPNAAIPLGLTTNCDAAAEGNFGTDDSAVLCVTSTSLDSTKKYDQKYQLTYRSLTTDLRVYRIELEGAGVGGGGRTIVIENRGTSETVQNGKTIIAVRIGVAII